MGVSKDFVNFRADIVASDALSDDEKQLAKNMKDADTIKLFLEKIKDNKPFEEWVRDAWCTVEEFQTCLEALLINKKRKYTFDESDEYTVESNSSSEDPVDSEEESDEGIRKINTKIRKCRHKSDILLDKIEEYKRRRLERRKKKIEERERRRLEKRKKEMEERERKQLEQQKKEMEQ